MSYSTYRRLMDGVCELCGLDNPDEFAEQPFLKVHGVDFLLGHGGEEHEDGLIVICKYGVPPVALLMTAMARLLEANLRLFAPGGLRFGINPSSHEVILTGVLPMARLDASTLIELLEQFAADAQDWRSHYFVFPPPEMRSQEGSINLPEDAETDIAENLS